MPGPRIDLHTHSTASDGTTAPAELMREAEAAGLDVIALTDHDTTGGWQAAADALPPSLRLVRGAEISCVADGISLHLLAYLFDPAEPAFATARRELRDSRVGRAERMAGLLEADGTGVTWEQVQQIAQGTVGRPHVAQALIERGHIATVSEAFTPEWIGTGGRYFVSKFELDVLAAIGLVVHAGGVAVFAHPSASKRGRTVGDDVIRDMAAAGLAGLEVDHVDHDDAAKAHLRELAAELGLLTTGSSDYHGTAKTVRLGEHTTSQSAYEQVLALATGVPVL
ncbi:MAG: PHP domain-containing protein [Frankiales bacterium]|nr:PHP domain-containing protein [Frankiales bacterium]